VKYLTRSVEILTESSSKVDVAVDVGVDAVQIPDPVAPDSSPSDISTAPSSSTFSGATTVILDYSVSQQHLLQSSSHSTESDESPESELAERVVATTPLLDGNRDAPAPSVSKAGERS